MNSNKDSTEVGVALPQPCSATSPQFIPGWPELAQVPDSETHRLEIDLRSCNGWIKEKANPEEMGHYLSTHTFYGMNHKHSTDVLRSCGFNVTCANWDGQNESTEPRHE